MPLGSPSSAIARSADRALFFPSASRAETDRLGRLIYASRLQRFVWYPAGGTSLVAAVVLVIASLALVVLGRGVFDPSQPLDMLETGTGRFVLPPLLLAANLSMLFLLARGDYLRASGCLRAIVASLLLLTLASMGLLIAFDAGMRAAVLASGDERSRHVLHAAVLAQGMIFSVLVVSGLIGASDGRVGRIGARMRSVRSALEVIDAGGARLDERMVRDLGTEIAALDEDLAAGNGLHVRRDRVDAVRPCLRGWLDLLASQPRYFLEDGSWRQDRRLVRCMHMLKKELRG